MGVGWEVNNQFDDHTSHKPPNHPTDYPIKTHRVVHGAERGEELPDLLDDLGALLRLVVGLDNVVRGAPRKVAHHAVQLLRGVGHDLRADAVELLALLADDVVEGQQLLADIVVVRLHLLLHLVQRVAHGLGLDGEVLPDAEGVEDALHPLPAEDAEDVVLEREEEARPARVALPPRAAPQLVVDAPGLVPLRADDVEPPQPPDLWMGVGMGMDGKAG